MHSLDLLVSLHVFPGKFVIRSFERTRLEHLVKRNPVVFLDFPRRQVDLSLHKLGRRLELEVTAQEIVEVRAGVVLEELILRLVITKN